MNWLHYLMEANLYLVIFYLGYCLFLNRETHYNLSRTYLLFSCLAAFILPVLQLGMLRPAPVLAAARSAQVMVQLQPVTTAPVNISPVTFNWDNALVYVYIGGTCIFLLLLLIKLYKLTRLAYSGTGNKDHGYRVIHIDEPNTAFSFFRYLFIGSISNTDDVIKHELVHIRQKHSVDIMLIELIKVISWFNPCIYLLQRSIRAVHEYIADDYTASSGSGALAYSSFLVENAYGLSGASVTNSFFNYNLLKKRIIMLNQKRSGKLARLKYLLTLPICAGLLCVSTLAFSKDYGWLDLAPKKSKAQVILMPKTTSTTTLNQTQLVTEQQPNAITDTTHKQHSYVIQRHPAKTSKKGFKYEEAGYLVNGKTDYRVLITKADGNQEEYWKSKASPAEITMLRDKYGYTFPNVPLYSKLPPPPPMPPSPVKDNMPPPAPPVNEKQVPPPPPAPPVSGEKSLSDLPEKVQVGDITFSKTRPVDYILTEHPLLNVNGTIYYITGKKPALKEIQIKADGETSVVTDATKEYGDDGKKGVVYCKGNVTVSLTPIKKYDL